MREYYLEMLTKAKSHSHIRYYKKMLQKLKAGPSPKKNNNKKIYVGSLNKEFKSMRMASLALNKHKDYVRRILNSDCENEHQIRIIVNE